MFFTNRFRTPLSIVFAFVATHNHFVLDRGGKVFNRSAPVIKLSADATEDDHLALLGLLNSSTACFWIKQVAHNKGSTVDQYGARQTTVAFENFWEHDGTKLKLFPLPSERPGSLACSLDRLANMLTAIAPASLMKSWPREPGENLHETLAEAKEAAEHLRRHMISLQEELDWECYRLYGLMAENLTNPNHGKEAPVDVELGQRAFEIFMARQMAAGELETTWFARHGSTPVTEIPEHWPAEYRDLVERRIEVIESDKSIGLIERPEYKRRWNAEPWESQQERAVQSWLLDRLESYFDFDGRMNDEGRPTAKRDIGLCSTGQLADVARHDVQFLEVGEVYTGQRGFDVDKLVADLVVAESVPLLPVLRYKPSGLAKRAEWEATWSLQRLEDEIDAHAAVAEGDPRRPSQAEAERLKREEVGDIPVPPKYKNTDFAQATYWRLRGKLDVPKERWVSFPGCEGPDGTLVFAWAGYDHLQLARAVSAYYVDVQERLGGREDPRLEPLLACLVELLPWLKQWHNGLDPEFNMPMGDYFEGFIQEEARGLGMTPDDVRAWQPAAKVRRTRA